MWKLLIVVALGVGAAILGFKAFERIASGQSSEVERVPQAEGSPAVPELPQPRRPAGFTGGNLYEPTNPRGEPVADSAAVYVFLHRTVPESPFQRTNDARGGYSGESVSVAVDAITNAWIIKGPSYLVDQFERLAKELDKRQTEVDLDFLLVAVSEELVRSWGLSMQFAEGASWLSALGVGYSGASLTLASGEFQATLDVTKADSGVRLLNAPVVRCVTGEVWQFSADQQVPIEVIQRGEGVVTTAYEYRSIGLGLSGVLRAGGDRQFRLQLEQRNGTIDAAARTDEGEPPQLKEQLLKTSLLLEVGRWSCAGGIRSWREERGKGIFGKRRDEEQELLLVFVRPRVFLGTAKPALPVALGDQEGLDDLGPWPFEVDHGIGVLPPKPEPAGDSSRWSRFESQEERALIEGMLERGHPSK